MLCSQMFISNAEHYSAASINSFARVSTACMRAEVMLDTAETEQREQSSVWALGSSDQVLRSAIFSLGRYYCAF